MSVRVAQRLSLVLHVAVIAALVAIATAAWTVLWRTASDPPVSTSWLFSVPVLSCLVVLVLVVADVLLSRLSERRAVILAVAFGVVLRIVWLAGVRNAEVSDFAIYHELARALASGQGYALTGPVGIEDLERYLGLSHALPYTTAYRAPGIALWAALLIRLFGDHPLVFKSLNIVLGAATAFLLARLAARMPVPRLPARAALAWSLYPSSVMAVNLYGSEIVFAFLLVLLAWLADRAERTQRPTRWWALAGVVAAAATLVRSTLLVLVSAMALALALRSRQPCRSTVVFVVFAALGLSPWAYRNYRVFHEVIPVCTSEGEFLGRHTRPNLPEGRIDATENAAYQRWTQETDEARKSREGYGWAMYHWRRMVAAGPSHVAGCLIRNIGTTFRTDLDILYWTQLRSHLRAIHDGPPKAFSDRVHLRLSSWTTAFYLALLTLGVAGAISRRRWFLAWPGTAFLACFFLGTFVSLILVRGQDRYHFSMMPFVILMASVGLSRLSNALPLRRKSAATPMIANVM